MLITSILLLRQKAIVRAFERAAATTTATASTPQQLGVTPGLAWHRLIAQGVLRCPGEGRYYLDSARWQQRQRARRRTALAVIGGIVLLVIGWLVWRGLG